MPRSHSISDVINFRSKVIRFKTLKNVTVRKSLHLFYRRAHIELFGLLSMIFCRIGSSLLASFYEI